jgi:hypothetical protein
MLRQTSTQPSQLWLCGCSVLHVAARPNLSGIEMDYPARRLT